MFWAVFPADPIESGIVPGVANTQQMEQIVPRSPTNEESVGNSFMPWSKILKTPKLFGRNLINHHPPSSSKCSSLSSSSRPLLVPFLFRTWLARPGDVGKVKQKFPWLKNCFYLRAVQLFSMRQPVDPELSLLVLFNIRQHTLERMKKSKGSSIKKFYCLISYFG